MRITIVDWQTQVVNQIFEFPNPSGQLLDILEFSSAYTHPAFRYFVTPVGCMPQSFQHDRHGLRIEALRRAPATS